jgi:rhodanese-related sulfurtransferase
MSNTTLIKSSTVTEIAPAESAEALAHFSAGFRFETDCWDVHAALAGGAPDFVLVDARSPDAFAAGHVGGAINVPHRKIVAGYMDSRWAPATVFVVYCAGPHCNGAQRAAARLAGLGRPVKLMIGGITGWLDEGFTLVAEPAAAT